MERQPHLKALDSFWQSVGFRADRVLCLPSYEENPAHDVECDVQGTITLFGGFEKLQAGKLQQHYATKKRTPVKLLSYFQWDYRFDLLNDIRESRQRVTLSRPRIIEEINQENDVRIGLLWQDVRRKEMPELAVFINPITQKDRRFQQ